jgi:hypothetical protein
MTTKTKLKFSGTKQARSKNTLTNIFETAELLVVKGNPSKFNARELSRLSGYAIGTISTRLDSIENVFISVIEKRRNIEIEKLCMLIQSFPKNQSIKKLATLLTDKTFESITKANPKVIRFIESRLMKRNQFSSGYYHFIDIASDALFKVHKKNISNTFGTFTKVEMKLFTRALMRVCERPFVEEDPIAGTKEHKKIAIKAFVRLFGK